MKKRRVVLTVAFASLLAGALTSCGKTGEKYDYELKVWAAEAAKQLTQSQCDAWAANLKEVSKTDDNPNGVSIKVTVQAVGEGEAAANMITDVESGADLFCFAQDQLARLKSAGALTEIVDETLKNDILTANDAAAGTASKVGDALVAYPLTSDNGYIMYYDKEVFTDPAELSSIEGIIAKCEAAGKKFYFECESSAWYGASFMLANGCKSLWETNKAGQFTGYQDNYNSAEGKAALKAFYPIMKSAAFINSSDANAGFTADPTTNVRSAAVVVSGTWDYAPAKLALGDKLGAAEMPTLSINGEAKHMGSFAGCKLLGVKPQTDTMKAAYAQSLAKSLSNQESQLERFNALGWGPSNLVAQQDEGVKANVALQAISAQSAYAIPQGQYPGDWWTSAAAINSTLKASNGTDAEIAKILKTYEATIDAYVNGEPDVE